MNKSLIQLRGYLLRLSQLVAIARSPSTEPAARENSLIDLETATNDANVILNEEIIETTHIGYCVLSRRELMTALQKLDENRDDCSMKMSDCVIIDGSIRIDKTGIQFQRGSFRLP